MIKDTTKTVMNGFTFGIYFISVYLIKISAPDLPVHVYAN